MSDDRLLDVRDLAVEFPGVKAVTGVTWHIDRGETLAIVGESGSGKSVSALALLRLTERDGGRIVRGEIRFRRRSGRVVDLVRERPRRLREIRGNEISMIFQEPMTSLNPVFTIGDQIGEAIRLHQGRTGGAARALALDMLRLVRIPEAEARLDAYPHQLSGGQRQRAMIAMALACRPSLLIADEPTTALDVTIQAQILDLIRLLQREIGMAVLFITHDMGVVAEMADRVVVMQGGAAVEEAPAEEIFAEPKHPYTRALLAAVPRLGGMRGRKRPQKFARSGPESDAAPERPDTVRTEEGPLLQVEGLAVRFPVGGGLFGRPAGMIHAVENVSFALQPGETLALVGESGSGKSTTARAILRLLEPIRGRILFGGQDITRLEGRALIAPRREMQMVFQDPFASLDPRLSVGSQIGEPLRIHHLARGSALGERVALLLRRVGLAPEHGRRFPHEFSGGQRQRICIARALALNPRLIVADEAVSALDMSIRAQIIDLLMDLQEEFGISYLFVSHDLAVVERISHRVAVMRLGQIVEIGPRAAVFEAPGHAYTRMLMEAAPAPDPRSRRRGIRLATGEPGSALRPPGFEPPPSRMDQVGPGHFVRKPEPGDRDARS